MKRGASMSWREIADKLAERLVHNTPCETHDRPVPKECPFCDDAIAMRLYWEKGGTVEAWEPPPGTHYVPINTVAERDQMGVPDA